jgi:hypothetical protein
MIPFGIEGDIGQDRGKKAMPEGGIRARIVARLVRVRFVREAMEERADLATLRAALREKPTPRRVWTGLVLIGISYIMGWPAVGLLALIAFHLGEPLVIVVGGPVTYGSSYLVLLAGSWLAGTRYTIIIFRWATRRVIEKLGGPMAPPTIS